MKKIRSIFAMFFLMLAVSCGCLIPGIRTEAAVLKNVLKAPEAAAGSWQIGNRYRYKSTKSYAQNEWLNIDGYIYYFKEDGYPRKGLNMYNGKLYYFDSEGALVTGWKKTKGNKYYFSKTNGAAKLGKKKIAAKYYYFHPMTGVMLTGWQKIGKNYYYFNKSTGVMATDEQIGEYLVDEKGRLVQINSKLPDTPSVEKTGNVDIFVGDSRTVGMCAAVHGGNCSKCIAQVSKDYEWLVGSALPVLESKLQKNPTATVVFNLGVNDTGHYALYIKKYQELMQKYPNARFFFLSVNPVDNKYSSQWHTSTSLNAAIKNFNKQIKKAFPNNYIDCYNYLIDNGFATVDGLHYTYATYKKIYNYILKQV